MLYTIRSRVHQKPVFTAEIGEYTRESLAKRAAVLWAIETNQSLAGTDLAGADLSSLPLSKVDFSEADLREASFANAVLCETNFSGARLRETNFIDSSLRGAILSGAELDTVLLNFSILAGAVVNGVKSSLLDTVPKIPDIHQNVYNNARKDGALNMRTWHDERGECGTAHCRGGWVTHLAGDEGKLLETIYGTDVAASLIYMASDPLLQYIPNYYTTNRAALVDMRKLAERGTKKNA